jgi:hypothetical protein
VTDDTYAGRSKYNTAFIVEVKEWYKHKNSKWFCSSGKLK